MGLCSSSLFRGPASGNSRKSPCANSLPGGSGIRRRNNSGAVAGVDANVFSGKVARPITSARFSGVQIHDNRDVFGKQAIGCGALIEIERLPFAENFYAGHGDFYQRWIEFYSSTACGGEDSSPIWIGSGECGLEQRRRGGSFRHRARARSSPCATDCELYVSSRAV